MFAGWTASVDPGVDEKEITICAVGESQAPRDDHARLQGPVGEVQDSFLIREIGFRFDEFIKGDVETMKAGLDPLSHFVPRDFGNIVLMIIGSAVGDHSVGSLAQSSRENISGEVGPAEMPQMQRTVRSWWCSGDDDLSGRRGNLHVFRVHGQKNEIVCAGVHERVPR